MTSVGGDREERQEKVKGLSVIENRKSETTGAVVAISRQRQLDNASAKKVITQYN